MNNYYYNNFIEPMLEEKPVLNKKKLKFIKKRKYLNLQILIHMGSPCHRYCICYYFSFNDIEKAFEM